MIWNFPALPADFGEFRLLDRLAETASGELFVARSASRNKAGGLCFVRVLDRDFVEEKLDEIFESERTRPRGDGLTNLFEAGRIGGIGCLAYDYCDRISLEQLARCSTRSGRFPTWAAVVQIGIELLDALELLHGGSAPGSVSHGDLRLSNVYISRKGRVVLGEAEPCWKSCCEKVLGFDAFVPPELRFAREEIIDADRAGRVADLWAAAAVSLSLLEMRSGRPASEFGLRKPRPLAKELGAPKELDDIFARALSPSSKERFEKGVEMRDELASCLEKVGRYTAGQDLKSWFLGHGEADIVAFRNLLSERIRSETKGPYTPLKRRGDDLSPGTLLGDRYRLGAPIADDGEICSFEARDDGAAAEKVVFVVRKEVLGDTRVSEAFRRKVDEVAESSHPAMARFEEMGQADTGSVYAVVERWKGERLNWLVPDPGTEKKVIAKARGGDGTEKLSTKGRPWRYAFLGAAGGAFAAAVGAVLLFSFIGGENRDEYRGQDRPAAAKKNAATVKQGPTESDRFPGPAVLKVAVAGEFSPGEMQQNNTEKKGLGEASESATKNKQFRRTIAIDTADTGDGIGTDRTEKSVKELVSEGRSLFRASRLDQAEARLRKAAKLAERRADVPYLLGKIAFQKGRYKKASRLIEKAVAMRPHKYPWRNYLGKVYFAMGDRARARKQWERVLKEDPDNEEARRFVDVE